MRFKGFALALSAFVLGACGGGDKNNTTDTAAATGAATDTAGAAGAATPAGGAGATATGTVHEVQMVGDAQGYRFEPANITIKAGDAVDFKMVSGGPHNVAFEEASIPAAGKAQLIANIPNSPAPLQSEMVMNPGQDILISFANVAPGTYNYNCTPHLAMGMKGVITVQ